MTYKTLANKYLDWTSETIDSVKAGEAKRNWCLLGLDETESPSLTQEGLRDYINTEEQAKAFADLKKKQVSQPKVFSFIQEETDMIDGIRKGMVERHKSRLTRYADDAIQKAYLQRQAVSIGTAKFLLQKERAEK